MHTHINSRRNCISDDITTAAGRVCLPLRHELQDPARVMTMTSSNPEAQLKFQSYRMAANFAQLHGQVTQVGQVLGAAPTQQSANLQQHQAWTEQDPGACKLTEIKVRVGTQNSASLS